MSALINKVVGQIDLDTKILSTTGYVEGVSINTRIEEGLKIGLLQVTEKQSELEVVPDPATEDSLVELPVSLPIGFYDLAIYQINSDEILIGLGKVSLTERSNTLYVLDSNNIISYYLKGINDVQTKTYITNNIDVFISLVFGN